MFERNATWKGPFDALGCSAQWANFPVRNGPAPGASPRRVSTHTPGTARRTNCTEAPRDGRAWALALALARSWIGRPAGRRPSGASPAVTPDRAASDSCRRSPTARRPLRPGFVPARPRLGGGAHVASYGVSNRSPRRRARPGAPRHAPCNIPPHVRRAAWGTLPGDCVTPPRGETSRPSWRSSRPAPSRTRGTWPVTPRCTSLRTRGAPMRSGRSSRWEPTDVRRTSQTDATAGPTGIADGGVRS